MRLVQHDLGHAQLAGGLDDLLLVASLLAKVAWSAATRSSRRRDRPLEAGDEVLAVTALAAEPDVRRLLGGQPGGSHTPG